jgi:hypothetical protein
MNIEKKNAFEEAAQRPQSNLLSEFYSLLKVNKKYWMIPIIVMLLIFGLIIVVGGTAAAPFIYTLF